MGNFVAEPRENAYGESNNQQKRNGSERGIWKFRTPAETECLTGGKTFISVSKGCANIGEKDEHEIC